MAKSEETHIHPELMAKMCKLAVEHKIPLRQVIQGSSETVTQHMIKELTKKAEALIAREARGDTSITQAERDEVYQGRSALAQWCEAAVQLEQWLCPTLTAVQRSVLPGLLDTGREAATRLSCSLEEALREGLSDSAQVTFSDIEREVAPSILAMSRHMALLEGTTPSAILAMMVDKLD